MNTILVEKEDFLAIKMADSDQFLVCLPINEDGKIGSSPLNFIYIQEMGDEGRILKFQDERLAIFIAEALSNLYGKDDEVQVVQVAINKKLEVMYT